MARKLCHRQEGIGADGMIVLLPHETYDFEWQFYNTDGSVAAMCGNGSRAAAHYAATEGLADDKMRFLTGAGVIKAEVNGDIVKSGLTSPVLKAKKIEKGDKEWWLVDTGVPHLVAFVDSVEVFDKKEAKELRDRFDANVNIACVDGGELYVRTYERGVEDETLACGTGMAAAFFRANMEGRTGDFITVVPKGGEKLEIAKEDGALTLKGEVRRIFEAVPEGRF